MFSRGWWQVDGVTRTIAKLLEHLQAEGHEAMIMGPNSSSMVSGAGATGKTCQRPGAKLSAASVITSR